MVLHADFEEHEADLILDLARCLWAKMVSGHRVQRAPKRGREMPRDPNALATVADTRDKSVADFCSKRARTTAEASQALAFENSAQIWNDEMSEEIKFNATKRLDNRLMALRMGTVLPSEVHTWDRELCDRQTQHKLALQAGRDKAAAKKQEKGRHARRPLVLTAQDKVCILPGAAQAFLSPTPQEAVRAANCAEVRYPRHATVVVAVVPASLDLIDRWAVALGGANVINHHAIIQSPRAVSLIYFPAVSVGHRQVWLSNGFVNEHPDLVAELRHAFRLPTCLWREVTQQQYALAVLRNAALPKRQRRDLQAIALLPASFSGALEPNWFTPSAFLSKICRLEPNEIGACGV